MSKRSDAARRRWANAPADARRANMAAAQAESARLRRVAAEQRAEQGYVRALDVVEAATPADLALAVQRAGRDRRDSLTELAFELTRIYAARDLDQTPTTERTHDAHRQDEEGAERANARPQEAQGHRPGQGNA